MSLARSKIRPILEVEDLKLSYGDYQVLENVSFSAKKGECLVVMGGSGCGKSTLLKSMIGLLPPNEGKVLVNSTINYLPNILTAIFFASEKFLALYNDKTGDNFSPEKG